MRKVRMSYNKYYIRSLCGQVFVCEWEKGFWYVKHLKNYMFRGQKKGSINMSATNILKGIAF